MSALEGKADIAIRGIPVSSMPPRAPGPTHYATPQNKPTTMSCGYSLKVGRVMRSKLTPFVFAGALTSALLGLTGGAHAATLVGSSISAEYDFPNLGTNLCTSCFTPSSFTVGSGIETTLAFSNTTITFDFSANQLVVNFVGGVGLNPATFSGPVFTLSGNPFPAIASVTGLPFANVTEPGDPACL